MPQPKCTHRYAAHASGLLVVAVIGAAALVHGGPLTPCSAPATSPICATELSGFHVRGISVRDHVEFPHGYGVNFARNGNLLTVTGMESDFKLNTAAISEDRQVDYRRGARGPCHHGDAVCLDIARDLAFTYVATPPCIAPYDMSEVDTGGPPVLLCDSILALPDTNTSNAEVVRDPAIATVTVGDDQYLIVAAISERSLEPSPTINNFLRFYRYSEVTDPRPTPIWADCSQPQKAIDIVLQDASTTSDATIHQLDLTAGRVREIREIIQDGEFLYINAGAIVVRVDLTNFDSELWPQAGQLDTYEPRVAFEQHFWHESIALAHDSVGVPYLCLAWSNRQPVVQEIPDYSDGVFVYKALDGTGNGLFADYPADVGSASSSGIALRLAAAPGADAATNGDLLAVLVEQPRTEDVTLCGDVTIPDSIADLQFMSDKFVIVQKVNDVLGSTGTPLELCLPRQPWRIQEPLYTGMDFFDHDGSGPPDSLLIADGRIGFHVVDLGMECFAETTPMVLTECNGAIVTDDRVYVNHHLTGTTVVDLNTNGTTSWRPDLFGMYMMTPQNFPMNADPYGNYYNTPYLWGDPADHLMRWSVANESCIGPTEFLSTTDLDLPVDRRIERVVVDRDKVFLLTTRAYCKRVMELYAYQIDPESPHDLVQIGSQVVFDLPETQDSIQPQSSMLFNVSNGRATTVLRIDGAGAPTISSVDDRIYISAIDTRRPDVLEPIGSWVVTGVVIGSYLRTNAPFTEGNRLYLPGGSEFVEGIKRHFVCIIHDVQHCLMPSAVAYHVPADDVDTSPPDASWEYYTNPADQAIDLHLVPHAPGYFLLNNYYAGLRLCRYDEENDEIDVICRHEMADEALLEFKTSCVTVAAPLPQKQSVYHGWNVGTIHNNQVYRTALGSLWIHDIEYDLNTNGVIDDIDILYGAADCNTNRILDVHEGLADCNTNGTLDICDSYTGNDCNTNGTCDAADAVPFCPLRSSPQVKRLMIASLLSPLSSSSRFQPS